MGELVVQAQINGAALILACSAIASGVAMLGVIGPGLGQGMAAGKAADAVGRQPASKNDITTTMVLGQVFAETGAIYCLIIAILLLYANPFINMFMEFVK